MSVPNMKRLCRFSRMRSGVVRFLVQGAADSAKSQRRRGIEVLELILVLPILFLSLAAGVQFASVMAVDATLCHASLEASRLASMECSEEQVLNRTNEFLAVHGLSLGPGAALTLEDGDGVLYALGDATLSSPTLGTPVEEGCVRATLLVETDSTPIPNTLRNYCVDYEGKLFEHVTLIPQPICDCPE